MSYVEKSYVDYYKKKSIGPPPPHTFLFWRRIFYYILLFLLLLPLLLEHSGEPSAPYNCTVNNITSNGLSVNCLPGYDGGLTQFFNLQVLQAKTDNRAVFNATGVQSGDFSVYSLEPATSYELHIWAENTKGRSSSVVLMVET